MTSLKGVHRSQHQGPGQSGPQSRPSPRLQVVAKTPRLGPSVNQPGRGFKMVARGWAPCIVSVLYKYIPDIVPPLDSSEE